MAERKKRERERENTPQNGAGCWKSISDPLTAEILPKKKFAINSDFLGVCAWWTHFWSRCAGNDRLVVTHLLHQTPATEDAGCSNGHPGWFENLSPKWADKANLIQLAPIRCSVAMQRPVPTWLSFPIYITRFSSFRPRCTPWWPPGKFLVCILLSFAFRVSMLPFCFPVSL